MNTNPISATMYWRKRSDNLGEDTTHNRFILAFVLMQLIGAVGLTIILLTALFSKHVKRHSTWYSFTASWIFSCLCYCLLFLAGQQVGDSPDLTLCTIQGALIYAAPALTACTTLSLVIHMYLNFRALVYTSGFDVRPITELMLLNMPYLVWLVIFIGILVFELQNPTTVRRSPKGTYCDSSVTTLSRVSSSIVVAATLVIMILLSVLGYRIVRSRRVVLSERVTFAMFSRVVAFSVIGVLALGISVSFVITNDHDEIFDMLLACLPLLAVLIFGSQLDLIRVWMCQRSGYMRANLKAVDKDEIRHLGSRGYNALPRQDLV